MPPISIIVQGDTLSSFNAVTYQWYLNGELIIGATGAVYVARESGEYGLEVTDANGCTSRSTGINVVINDVGKLDNHFVSIYPNPFSNFIIVQMHNSDFHIRGVEVTDVLGRKVFYKDISNNQSDMLRIDLSELNNGTYSVKLYSDEIQKSQVIIKQALFK